MPRSTRNSGPPNKYDALAKEIVADATKGGRKPKNPSKPSKSKKHSFHNDAVQDVIAYSPPPVKEKASKTPAGPLVYTISTNVMWKEKDLRPGCTTSTGFDFHQFNTEAIQAVDNKASKKGYRMILKSAIATLSCSSNQKSMASRCSDESEWKLVHTLAIQWLEEKRKGVTVRIVHTYGPKEDSSSSEQESSDEAPPAKKQKKNQPASDEDSSSNDSSDSYFSTASESEAKKKKKKAKKPKSGSATAKQIHHAKEARKLEKKLGQEGHKIMKITACAKPGCPGRTHYCWQPEGASGPHYLLQGDQVTKWNKALARKEPGVDVETPPRKIQNQLKD